MCTRGIAFSIVDDNRAALRLRKGNFSFAVGAVLLAGDDAAESVFGLDSNDIAGVDRENRFCVGTVDVVERTLLLDRESWRFPAWPLASARCHDRGLSRDRRSSRYPRNFWRLQIARQRRIFASFVLVQLPSPPASIARASRISVFSK